jgi:hypothetical protein
MAPGQESDLAPGQQSDLAAGRESDMALALQTTAALGPRLAPSAPLARRSRHRLRQSNGRPRNSTPQPCR